MELLISNIGGVSEILCAGPERLPHHGGVAGD